MSSQLSSKTKEQIKNHIKKIESKTSAEIVCVVTEKSDRYRYIIFLYSALLALVSPFILIFIGVNFADFKMVEFQILVFLFISFLLEYSDFKYKIIPKHIKQNRCEKLAFYQFQKIGVNKTSNHKALLLLVCIKERYIKIVADSEIDKVIPQDIWRNIVKNFVEFAKKDKIEEGILNIIEECGKILTKKFPRDKNSVDELKDDVIEI
jgi:putative membrane protein